MGETDVARWVEKVQTELARSSLAGRAPTFFEFVTVMALGYFAEQGCDLVVWETGLGGRLDATNIVKPEVSVITNIDLDHQAWLGTTYESIAAEKAGIIKPGVPVVTAAQPGRGREVIAAAAERLSCPLTILDPEPSVAKERVRRDENSRLTVVGEDEAWRWASQDGGGAWPRLNLAGRHQRMNAAVALATLKAMEAAWPVSAAAMRAGLETANWPGRMQVVRRPGGLQVLLDGAHNPAGAEALRAGIEDLWPGVPPAVILGVLADKDWEVMVRTLAPMASRIVTVPVGSTRTLPPETLAAACQQANPQIPVRACQQLSEALAAMSGEQRVVIAGSLYLIGEAVEQLGVAVSPGPSERGLNEWKTNEDRNQSAD